MKTIIKAVVEFIVMLNALLCSLGITTFENVTADMVYLAVSLIAAVIAFAYAIWKNHNFTDGAKKAQEILDGYKNNEVEISDGVDRVIFSVPKHGASRESETDSEEEYPEDK